MCKCLVLLYCSTIVPLRAVYYLSTTTVLVSFTISTLLSPKGRLSVDPHSYICSEYRAEHDPMKTMHVLQAIRWAMDAWENDVTMTTVSNCWVKSQVLSGKYGPQTKAEAESSDWKEREVIEKKARHAAEIVKMDEQVRDLVRQNRIAQAMSINQFLNPEDKEVYDTDDIVVDDIVAAYSTEERAYETDEEDVPQRRILAKEAIEALQTLRLYEEQQDDGDSRFISGLGRHERVMRQRAEQGLKQSSIGSYFT